MLRCVPPRNTNVVENQSPVALRGARLITDWNTNVGTVVGGAWTVRSSGALRSRLRTSARRTPRLCREVALSAASLAGLRTSAVFGGMARRRQPTHQMVAGRRRLLRTWVPLFPGQMGPMGKPCYVSLLALGATRSVVLILNFVLPVRLCLTGP